MARSRKTTGRRTRPKKASRKSVPKKQASKKSASEKQLSEIEELLGEEFTSLKQARAALREQSGPKPNKKYYTVKELSSRNNRKISDFLTDLEKNQQDIDNLKDAQDFWAFAIKGQDGRFYHSYQLFSNTNSLTNKLGSYKGLQDESTKLLGNIQVIRVKGVDAGKYFEHKRAEVQESWKRRRDQKRRDRRREQKQRKQLKKIPALQKQLREHKAEIERLKKQLKKKK